MKKIILAALIIFLTSPLVAYTQDDPPDTNEKSWDSYMQDYTKLQNQSSKPITQQEFDTAAQTIKNFQKKPKSHWWSKKKPKESVNENSKEAHEAPDIPSSPDPLLRLPVDVYINGAVIQDGFYLIDSIKRDNKYFLRFKQGNKPVIEVEGKIITGKNTVSAQNTLFTEIINNSIKINYQNNGLNIETILPFCIQEKK